MTAAKIDQLPAQTGYAENRSLLRRRGWDYAGVFATEFAVMLGQVVFYKLVAMWLGQTGFSEYALGRRVLSFLQPIALLGLGVGLPRYLALAEGRNLVGRGRQYLWGALVCVGGATAIMMTALILWPRWCSYLFFGDTAHGRLLLPLALMLAGLSMHSLTYAFLRGKLAVFRANGLQLLNNVLVPFAVIALCHQDIRALMLYVGLAWILISGVALFFMMIGGGLKNPARESRELLSYGLQRIPGDFALAALLVFPAIFVAHIGGVREAGFVAFGLAMVNMVAGAFSPVGVILLPNVSRAIGSQDFQSVRHEIALIRRLVLLFSFSIVVLFEVFGQHLLRIYLGESYVAAQKIVNVLMLGGLPLAFYIALRSALDAIHHKAVNAINLLVALGVFLGASGVGLWLVSPQAVLWSFSVALLLLGLLTAREIQKALKSMNMISTLDCTARL